MTHSQIINQEAYNLGKTVRGEDRKLIEKMTGAQAVTIHSVLSGSRRAIRGQSKTIVEAANKIAEFNKSKAELL
ncbi:MAG: hypothetical protein PF444_01135 [Bacteroidales bacterium]|jgi:hypothetical protein|nr:hypothetical protein [Bacteroidales bacterium]